MIGAALVVGAAVSWSTVWDKVIIPMVTSPVVGLILAFALMRLIARIFANKNPQSVGRGFRHAQTFSAAAMALGHGLQDAQKTMGVIVLALVSTGHLAASDPDIPLWVVASCAGAISLGTAVGGKKIMKTLGRRVIDLDPPRIRCRIHRSQRPVCHGSSGMHLSPPGHHRCNHRRGYGEACEERSLASRPEYRLRMVTHPASSGIVRGTRSLGHQSHQRSVTRWGYFQNAFRVGADAPLLAVMAFRPHYGREPALLNHLDAYFERGRQLHLISSQLTAVARAAGDEILTIHHWVDSAAAKTAHADVRMLRAMRAICRVADRMAWPKSRAVLIRSSNSPGWNYPLPTACSKDSVPGRAWEGIDR